MADRGPYSEGCFQRFVSIKFGSPASVSINANVSPEDGIVGHAAFYVTINGNVLDEDKNVQGYPGVTLIYDLNDSKKIREDLGLAPTALLPPTLTFEAVITCEISSPFKNNNLSYVVTGPNEFLDELNMLIDPAYPVGVKQSVFRLTLEVDISKKPVVTSFNWS